MVHLNSVFSPILHLHSKYRESASQRVVVNPTAITATTFTQPRYLRNGGHIKPEPTVQVVQPSTETLPEGAEEVEVCKLEFDDDDDEKITSKTLFEVDGQSVEQSADDISSRIEDLDEYEVEEPFCNDEEEDKGVPEAFPYDLARKTRHEMVIRSLYVALVEDDWEIAALRTVQREKFTHIVRVTFEPLSPHNNIAPSSWAVEEITLGDGRTELRLTCPALTLHYGNKLTALKDKQLLAARDHIAQVLPGVDDEPEEQLEERNDSRVLVVGPPDRSVDVMAILVCYMAFLTSSSADYLLYRLRSRFLVDSHWGGDILGKDSLGMADQVSRKPYK